MMDNDKKTKPKYAPPVVVPLGELAIGVGACSTGIANKNGCALGTTAKVVCGTGSGGPPQAS